MRAYDLRFCGKMRLVFQLHIVVANEKLHSTIYPSNILQKNRSKWYDSYIDTEVSKDSKPIQR